MAFKGTSCVMSIVLLCASFSFETFEHKFEALHKKFDLFACVRETEMFFDDKFCSNCDAKFCGNKKTANKKNSRRFSFRYVDLR